MIPYHHLGFFIGLLGSIHCAAMCGPLQFALQGTQALSVSSIFKKMLYQLGRVLSYAIIGVLVGSVAKVADITGLQQAVSILSGVMLLILGSFQLFSNYSSRLVMWQNKVVVPLMSKVSAWRSAFLVSFGIGMLNGILPCGMVYMALISSLNAASVGDAVLYMVFFGLGTIPLMFLLSLSSYMPIKIPKIRFQKVLPFLLLGMGIWFILRGANLGIPYLSPLIELDGVASCK